MATLLLMIDRYRYTVVTKTSACGCYHTVFPPKSISIKWIIVIITILSGNITANPTTLQYTLLNRWHGSDFPHPENPFSMPTEHAARSATACSTHASDPYKGCVVQADDDGQSDTAAPVWLPVGHLHQSGPREAGQLVSCLTLTNTMTMEFYVCARICLRPLYIYMCVYSSVCLHM